MYTVTVSAYLPVCLSAFSVMAADGRQLERTNVEMEEKLRTHETEKAELIEKIGRLNKLILVSSSVSSHKFSSMMKWDGTRMSPSPVQGKRSPSLAPVASPAAEVDGNGLLDLSLTADDNDDNFLLEDSSPGAAISSSLLSLHRWFSSLCVVYLFLSLSLLSFSLYSLFLSRPLPSVLPHAVSVSTYTFLFLMMSFSVPLHLSFVPLPEN